MKKKYCMLCAIIIVMTILSSCGSSVKMYKTIEAYSIGKTPVGGETGVVNDCYVFRTSSDYVAFDKQESKQDIIYNHTLDMMYFATKSSKGHDYKTIIYSGKEESYLVSYHETTGQIIGIVSDSHDIAITRSEIPLTSEQDFIDYAKTIAKDFINIEEYVVSIVPKDPPDPGTATAYRGDEYIFRKQLCGVDTAECLIVSITPDGAVGAIRHQAVDQFKDFEGITLDEKLIDSAVEKAIKVARPKSSGKVEIEEYDYYLMNDGGTLLLYLELSSTSTPIDEEKTTDPANPVYREEDTVHIGTVAVVPIAEVKK